MESNKTYKGPENIELVKTSDGSHSLYLPALDEHYHSHHGAIQEANHVFIDAGFRNSINRETNIKILEVGFGTGLNCFLTVLESMLHDVRVEYTGVEAYPLSERLTNQLNYASLIPGAFSIRSCFDEIHSLEWGSKYAISSRFSIQKIQAKIQEAALGKSYNLVYYDAFGPRAQAEMWTSDIFQNIYHSMSEYGILVTYCAKGDVKRMLKNAGFKIETLPGPPGKREMTRALKI